MTDKPGRPNNWMWPNQSEFLAHARESFTEILGELNCKLDQEILLVGFQTDQMSGIPTVRLDPEVNDILAEELGKMFDGIKDQYAPYLDEDLSDDWNTAYGKHDRFGWEVTTGIRDVLKSELEPGKWICFSSVPHQNKESPGLACHARFTRGLRGAAAPQRGGVAGLPRAVPQSQIVRRGTRDRRVKSLVVRRDLSQTPGGRAGGFRRHISCSPTRGGGI
jgi:hypothetical protein